MVWSGARAHRRGFSVSRFLRNRIANTCLVGVQFRVDVPLDLLLTNAEEPCLPSYLTRGLKEDIHTFPLCSDVSRLKWKTKQLICHRKTDLHMYFSLWLSASGVNFLCRAQAAGTKRVTEWRQIIFVDEDEPTKTM